MHPAFSVCKRLFFWVIQAWIVCLLGDALFAFAHRPHDVIDAVGISPNFEQDQTVFVVTRQRVKKSINGGLKWKALENGLNYQYELKAIEISPSYAQDGTVFLTSNGDGRIFQLGDAI